MNHRQLVGSYTAKGGFENEFDICEKFSNYKEDAEAKSWLKVMGYDFSKVTSLAVIQIPVRINHTKAQNLGVTLDAYQEASKYKKADVQLKVKIEIDSVVFTENLSLKKANKSAGFNQIDKRAVDTYQQMWSFSDELSEVLKFFTGEHLPSEYRFCMNPKDQRRLFITELRNFDRDLIVNFFTQNKHLIISDSIMGRGALKTDYVLVTERDGDDYRWIIADIATVCNFYCQGEVVVTPRGSLKIGRITMQRKGGTPDPKSLQFKFNPLELFTLGG